AAAAVTKEHTEVALGRRLLLAIITPVTLLVAVGVALALQIVRMSETEKLVEQTDHVIAAVNDLQKQITDQETGLRGFLLTSDRSFLEPYDRAHPLDVLASLRTLLADNPAQEVRVDEVRKSYDGWLAIAVPPLELGGNLNPFRTESALAQRKDRMDSVRDAI